MSLFCSIISYISFQSDSLFQSRRKITQSCAAVLDGMFLCHVELGAHSLFYRFYYQAAQLWTYELRFTK